MQGKSPGFSRAKTVDPKRKFLCDPGLPQSPSHMLGNSPCLAGHRAVLVGEFQRTPAAVPAVPLVKTRLLFSPTLQSMTTVAADSTTVTKTPSAPTPSRDTAVPASRATWETAPSAEVGLLLWGAPPPAAPAVLSEIPAVAVVAERSWFLLLVSLQPGHCAWWKKSRSRFWVVSVGPGGVPPLNGAL